jgi:hypothetical protein
MAQERKGPLEALNIRLEKEQLEGLKKTMDQTKTILDAIGSIVKK